MQRYLAAAERSRHERLELIRCRGPACLISAAKSAVWMPAPSNSRIRSSSMRTHDARALISGHCGAKGQPVTAHVQSGIGAPERERRPPYNRSVNKITDTSEVPALLRNAFTGQVDGNAVMLLSAADSHLGRILELLGTRELIKAKVKTLVISEAAGPSSAAAMEKLLVSWPTPIVLCGVRWVKLRRFRAPAWRPTLRGLRRIPLPVRIEPTSRCLTMHPRTIWLPFYMPCVQMPGIHAL